MVGELIKKGQLLKVIRCTFESTVTADRGAIVLMNVDDDGLKFLDIGTLLIVTREQSDTNIGIEAYNPKTNRTIFVPMNDVIKL
jgi:hypothetical protein